MNLKTRIEKLEQTNSISDGVCRCRPNKIYFAHLGEHAPTVCGKCGRKTEIMNFTFNFNNSAKVE